VTTSEVGAGVGEGYEAPTFTVLGSVSELTFTTDKKLGPSDGFTYQGSAITNASP
jgi:hypothetical protein